MDASSIRYYGERKYASIRTIAGGSRYGASITKGERMESNQIEELMHNWASWARTREIIPCSCRSLESRYIAPPVWYYPELRVEPNLKEAMLVERILVSQTFPRASMAAIVYAYVYPWRRFEAALRKINHFHPPRHVKPSNFEDFLKDSKRVLFNRLKFDSCIPEMDLLISLNNLITAEMRACQSGEVLSE